MTTKKTLGWLVASLGCLALGVVGGYYLGDKNATKDMLEGLETVCSRQAIIEFPSGRQIACLPLQQVPELEEKLQRGLDKKNEA